MRINRFLAAAGFGSRRACEILVTEGKVSINGHFIRDLSTTVEPDDDVRVGGKLAKATAPVYLLLHKPRGYVCTRSDERGRQTIFDLIPTRYASLFHVGRLDKDSEGLILLTNDGGLSQRLTHPGHGIDKEYEVLLNKPFDREEIPRLLRGIYLEEGRARFERVRVLEPSLIRVVLRQGMKRQIRLMLYRRGYEVKRLLRMRIGGLEMESLRAGQWRLLKASEAAKLAEASATKSPRRKKPSPSRRPQKSSS